MTREQVEQALREAVQASNQHFDQAEFEAARDWHNRSVALHELLYGPIDRWLN